MSIDTEINELNGQVNELLHMYGTWSNNFEYGAKAYDAYYKLVDFANFRMETVSSCLELIGNDKIADSFTLERTLLENYLLFLLMCRGHKYFQVRSLKGKKPAEIEQILADEQQYIGKGDLLEIRTYPKLDKHLMYIRKGVTIKGDPDYSIPFFNFVYGQFDPLTMRLDEKGYFTYFEPEDDEDEQGDKLKKGQEQLHRQYLSYDALLQNLLLNEIVDDEAVRRIEAHYTFLSTYVHPTNDAFRDLHKNSNEHSFKTMVGFDKPYKESTKLLASIYNAKIAVSIIKELIEALKGGPSDFLQNINSQEIESLCDAIESRNPFWFIFNDATNYDKFEQAVNITPAEELNAIGGDYTKLSNEQVKFERDIMRRFEGSLGGWHNQRVGRYQSPYN